MNAKKLVSAAVLFAAAGAAFADGSANYPPQSNVTSNKTRAEVVAELRQAQAAGEVTIGDRTHFAATPTQSTRTRAEVRNELQKTSQAPHLGRNS